MTSIATHIGGSLAIIFLAGTSPALSGSNDALMTSSITLMCKGGANTPICKALSAALSETLKGEVSQIVDVAAPERPTTYMTVTFVEKLHTPEALSGHLAWETTSGMSGVGPTLELSVMDTMRTQQIVNSYAQQLVELSSIPTSIKK